MRGMIPLALISLFGIILAACSTGASTAQESTRESDANSTELSQITTQISPTIAPTDTVPDEVGETEGGSEECESPFENTDTLLVNTFWPGTNFCKYSIDPNEIYLGVVRKDGIPALIDPAFTTVELADEWLGEDWPIMRFENNGDVRAYPLAILIWHEIVNDIVGGKPVALTFCPLCNATIAFDRTLENGTVLDFGTTGNLRNSDLVMYDRLTESWWQQFTGEAIIGDMTGTKLEFLPSQIISWRDFKSAHPDAMVLSRETGHDRPYGQNPYPGYDNINSSPWFPGLGDDDRLPAMERVTAVKIDDQAIAYPFTELKKIHVINDSIAEQELVVFWKAGTGTPFGNVSVNVGSSGVFSREVNDQTLTFQKINDGFEDLETMSLWNIVGEAIEGPLVGEHLTPIVSGEHFWFAWSVFIPDTIVWQP